MSDLANAAERRGAQPPNGLRDSYGTIGYGWKKKAGFDAIALSAAYHRYDSDRLGQHYGDEINAQAVLRKGHYAALLKFADYFADGFGTDTRKFWASLEWAI